MTGSTISGTVTQTVVLGKTGYGRRLTITATGKIAPTAYGAAGIYDPAGVSNAHITNQGTVLGASGGSGSGATNGGIGIDFAAAGKLSNSGRVVGGYGLTGGAGVLLGAGGAISNTGNIAGGEAATALTGTAGLGGAGVDLVSGSLTNIGQGIITGGSGGYGYDRASAGAGGAGVDVGAAGMLLNRAVIVGGTGGYSYPSGGVAGANAAGGAGIQVDGGVAVNHGRSAGGRGGSGYNYGDGARGGAGALVNAGTLSSDGGLSGGTGGYCFSADGNGDGEGGYGLVVAGGSVSSTGIIRGGTGGFGHFYAPNGGAGVLQSGGSLVNGGRITGGNGGDSSEAQPGAGGIGVVLTGGAFINNGAIAAGTDGFSVYYRTGGGEGGVAMSGGTMTNNGVITGEAGHTYYTGGAGVSLTGGTLTNAGTITGAVGGNTGNRYGGTDAAGTGGAGVIDGGAVFNAGLITGGAGGNDTGTGMAGNGGAGAIIDGGTLTTSGTISGGAPGTSSTGGAVMGDAVDFQGSGGTLVVEQGAVFNGAVEAGAGDTLALGAANAGSISGLGSEFSGFQTLAVQSGSDWTLTGANTLDSGSTLQTDGRFSIAGSLTDAGTATIVQGGTLALSNGGTALFSGITLDNGRLNVTGTGALTIGSAAGGAAGAITIEAGAAITGWGLIGDDAITDDGSIVAKGGTLSINAAISGTGTVSIDAHATLTVNNVLTGAGLKFSGAAELVLVSPPSVTSTIAGFGSFDVVDLQNLTATTLSYAGGTLTLSDGSAVVDKLFFSGSFTQADFALKPDGSGGTDVVYAGTRDVGARFTEAAQAFAMFWHR